MKPWQVVSVKSEELPTAPLVSDVLYIDKHLGKPDAFIVSTLTGLNHRLSQRLSSGLTLNLQKFL